MAAPLPPAPPSYAVSAGAVPLLSTTELDVPCVDAAPPDTPPVPAVPTV